MNDNKSPPKITRIIEHQPHLQMTPSEIIDTLKDELDNGKITHMVVIYHNKEDALYVAGSATRDYMKSAVLWDVEQWKQWYLSMRD